MAPAPAPALTHATHHTTHHTTTHHTPARFLQDLVAYVIIVVGGLYPVTKGNVKEFLSSKFWRQPFVMIVLANDVMLAICYEVRALVQCR